MLLVDAQLDETGVLRLLAEVRGNQPRRGLVVKELPSVVYRQRHVVGGEHQLDRAVDTRQGEHHPGHDDRREGDALGDHVEDRHHEHLLSPGTYVPKPPEGDDQWKAGPDDEHSHAEAGAHNRHVLVQSQLKGQVEGMHKVIGADPEAVPSHTSLSDEAHEHAEDLCQQSRQVDGGHLLGRCLGADLAEDEPLSGRADNPMQVPHD
mmetsp:Transcript_69412/g.206783  ORF Transcript_69412/g.206783 Transcript_69412/m.206783 type:complete len:206 (-) Transcript_69412:410-1027(-)